MPDPDIEALQRQLRNAQALANAPRDPYDDRQGHARARAQDAADRALFLARRVAELTAKRKADLAAIHSEARRAGIGEVTRRAMIVRISDGRTYTSADLTAPERVALLRELGGGKRPPKRAGRGPSPAAMDRQTMLTRVEQLLTVLRLPWAYAEAILRRQRGITAQAVACPLQQANPTELRGVIAALDARRRKLTPDT
jgi:hypothetical protein